MSLFLQRLAKKYDYQEPSLEFFTIILKNIILSVQDKIIITDEKFRLIFSNINKWNQGENIFHKLNLKKQHIDVNSYNTKRTVLIGKKTYTYFVDIIKICSEEQNGYLLILKKTENNGKIQQNSEINYFLKHNLKTQILSQIMALQLVLKTNKDNYLLQEILSSAQNSYLSLKNLLTQEEVKQNDFQLQRKETFIKPFAENIISESKNFINSGKNNLELIVKRNSRIYIDSKKLKDAIISIIYKIGTICFSDKKIHISIDVSHNLLRILIKFHYGKLDKNIFTEKNEQNNEYYISNNGLNFAKKIINAHNGKIRIINEKDFSVIKILMPK